MICYTTTFLAVPGFEKEVMTILREHVKQSKKEQGLIASQAYRSETEPRRFFVYHVFTDNADVDVRRATKFYGEYILASIYGMFDTESLSMDRYQPITELDIRLLKTTGA
jgi:quinol monooxygenase YgiN